MIARRLSVVIWGCLSSAALLAQTATPSPQTPVSTAVNKGLPSWLRFGGEERVRMENLSGVGFKTVGDLYLLNRLRVDMDVKPVSWLVFYFEAQDARVFGQNSAPAPTSQKNAMDLRVGYVRVGGEETFATFRAGRQPLYFGEGRVLSDPNWSNVGRVFDAARLTLHSGKRKVDLFSGLLVKVDPMGCDQSTPGAHLHGAYGSLGGLVPKATIEPYLIWRLEHNYKSETGQKGNLDAKTVGFRWVGTLPLRFDYGVEMAKQFGSSAGDSVAAWAGHWVVGYTLRDQRRQPRFYTEFNRASGDANARDSVHGDYDPMFASTHDRLGLSDLFTWTNLVHWRTGFGFTVRPRLTLGAAYNSYWLANAHGSLFVCGKAVARSADGSAGRHIGHEADVQATWTTLRSTQVSVGYARLFPGEVLNHTTAGAPYSIVFTSIAQRF